MSGTNTIQRITGQVIVGRVVQTTAGPQISTSRAAVRNPNGPKHRPSERGRIGSHKLLRYRTHGAREGSRDRTTPAEHTRASRRDACTPLRGLRRTPLLVHDLETRRARARVGAGVGLVVLGEVAASAALLERGLALLEVRAVVSVVRR